MSGPHIPDVSALVCDPHGQPATLVVAYYESRLNDRDSFDVHERLACDPTCCDPLWSGERWMWLALTPERAEEITGLSLRAGAA